MYKKILSGLVLLIFVSSQLISYAQEPERQELERKYVQPSANPNQPPSLPPIVLIAGKEKDSFQRVFIEKVKTGDQVNVKLLMFDREPGEKITVNSYGLPGSAKLNVVQDEKTKNRAEATLTWTPSMADTGFRTVVIEAINSKGLASRVSLSYKVNK